MGCSANGEEEMRQAAGGPECKEQGGIDGIMVGVVVVPQAAGMRGCVRPWCCESAHGAAARQWG